MCPHKKRTKESGWGEALTAKSFVTAVSNHHFYPNFEPPSPQTLLPAPVGSCDVVVFWETTTVSLSTSAGWGT